MAQDTAQATPEAPSPGPVTRAFVEALPGLEFEPVKTPLDETLLVKRDDLQRVLETAKNHPALQFDFLRSLSGVDWISELEVAYHLWSYSLNHGVGIKARCPYEDPHVPTVSHLWATANWHERECHEMFGIVFDGHPDLRPLLTEEGLGYYILRKSHPLAEIEEWQENYLAVVEQAKAQMAAVAAGPEGAAPPADEKASKVALAQKKAATIKKVREEAQAQGLSPEAVKAAVQEALKKLEEEEAAPAAAAAPAAPARPAAAPSAGDRAAKIAAAQKKAALITKTREEARAKGLSPEEERKVVAEALKKFSEEQGG